MLLQINDDFRITNDSYNFILEQRTIPKETEKPVEENWKPVGYYSKLEHALQKVLDKQIKASVFHTKSIQELIDVIKAETNRIVEAVQEGDRE